MVTESFSVDSPTVLLVGALLLWFHTVWQSYVIEVTRSRLAGLQAIWRETLRSDPAQRGQAVHAVECLLESINEELPRLSLAFLVGAVLVPSRETCAGRAQVNECLGRLPSGCLKLEALSIVEAATHYVALAALKRSLLTWVLAPLWLAAFIVWSIHWQLLAALVTAPQVSWPDARLRLRRRILGPFGRILTSVSLVQ
jgi:hypothetical protein